MFMKLNIKIPSYCIPVLKLLYNSQITKNKCEKTARWRNLETVNRDLHSTIHKKKIKMPDLEESL